MTMNTATGYLWQAVHQLRDDLSALRLQAVEDYPRDEPNKLVEHVGSVGETLAGWTEQVVDGTAKAVAAIDYPPDLPRFRQALDTCADGVERISAQLHEQLAATSRLDDLNALARQGGPELRAWVGAIKHALDQVHQSLSTVQTALTTCWQELAERAVLSPAPEPADTTRRT
jgi:hypothetical protein